MTTNFPGQQASRKRLAKLLGVAPFRLDLHFDGKNLNIALDGAPLPTNHMAVFEADVRRLTSAAKNWMN